MADSLDDFFARKDQAKKSKGKKTSATFGLDNQNKHQDDGLVPTKVDRKKDKDKVITVNIKLGDEDDGEWKDIEDEPDYSGLKISSLTIRDKEEEVKQQKLQEASDQLEIKKNESGGPWKLGSNPTIATSDSQLDKAINSDSEEDSSIKEQQPQPEVNKPQTYVPPHLRNRESSSNKSSSGPLAPTRMSVLKSKAPEIENTSEFPTLGAVVSNAKPVEDHTMNTWKDTSSRSAAPLRVENKFDALRDNDK